MVALETGGAESSGLSPACRIHTPYHFLLGQPQTGNTDFDYAFLPRHADRSVRCQSPILPAAGRFDGIDQDLHLLGSRQGEHQSIHVVIRIIGVGSPDVACTHLVFDSVVAKQSSQLQGDPVRHVDEGQDPIASDWSRRTAGIHLHTSSWPSSHCHIPSLPHHLHNLHNPCLRPKPTFS